MKNGARNITAGFINRVILMLLPVLLRSTIVSALGSGYLGLSSLFLSILDVLNLSELGFGEALVYSMYKPIAENDEERICAILGFYKKIYHIISIVILVIGLFLMPFIPHLIRGEWPEDINIYLLYLIYLFNAILSYSLFAHKRSLLTAYQRNDIISNVSTILSLTSYSIQIIVLLITQNYYVYVCILPIFTIVNNLVVAVITKKKYPYLYAEKKAISILDKNAIKKHVKGLAIQKIGAATRNSFDNIIISMSLGLTATAIYGNYYSIMFAVHIFLYQIPNAIRASVGNSITSEGVSKNFRDFNLISFIYMWISGWCVVCLICLFQPFMQIWMGRNNLFPMDIVVLFCVYFIEFSFSDILWLYRDAAGLWWHGRYAAIIEALANLILNFILGYLFGVRGILIATIITFGIISNGYYGYIIFKYYFGLEKIRKSVFDNLTYLMTTVFVSIITFMCCQIMGEFGIKTLLIRGCICLVLPNILFFALYRKNKYFNDAVRFLKNIAKTLKRV